jgi:peptide-methionine (R)-S-oxide reductase
MKQINQNLSEEEKKVLFEKGTEAPFSGEFVNNDTKGMYVCKNCGAELFSSDTKFESSAPGLAGWPAFTDPVNQKNVILEEDNALGMHRLEVKCANCGAHLGHVFEDAGDIPHADGKHYCINSVCLDLKEKQN